MTIILEHRKVKGKKLLIKFNFDSRSHPFERDVVCYSLDKYLSLDVWIRIYERIARPIDRYVRHETRVPESETILMQRTQLELSVKWEPLDSAHASIFCAALDTFYQYAMIVGVRAVSKIDEYIQKSKRSAALRSSREEHIKSESITPPNAKDHVEHEANTNGCENGESSNANANKRSHEEYVPAATTATPKSRSLCYTPSKGAEARTDEYTPTKLNAAAEIDSAKKEPRETDTHYVPSPISINNNIHHNKSEQIAPNQFAHGIMKSPRRNRKRVQPERKASQLNEQKPNVSDDLFGDSSGPDDAGADENAMARVTTSRGTRDRRAKLTVPKSLSHKPQTSTATSSSRAAKRFKAKTATKTESAGDMDMEDINGKILQKIRSNTLLDSSGNPIGLEVLLDLKDLLPADITDTFAEHSDVLRNIFEEKKKECRLKPQKDYNFLIISSILITSKQTHAMVDKLTEELTIPELHGEIPFHHLFWEFMVPEWALLVFMKRYHFTRAEALSQLEKHDQAVTMNSTLDFDKF